MVSDVRPLLAERITWYRQRAGLSQRALADKLKVDKATIWRAEQGEGWPDYKTLEAIADALGVSTQAFFIWETPEDPRIELFKIISTLDDLKAQTLLSYAKQVQALSLENPAPESEGLKPEKEKNGAS